METKLKNSVAILLAHIIKVDHRDIEKEAPLFCQLMGEDFDCDTDEAKGILERVIAEPYDLDTHIGIIAQALKDDRLSKYHLLEQINHMIYSDTIDPQDYEIFEKIKKRLFDAEV